MNYLKLTAKVAGIGFVYGVTATTGMYIGSRIINKLENSFRKKEERG